MEDTFIVIMIKDIETGFLEKELGSYRIMENENLIYSTYAVGIDSSFNIHMKITCDKDVSDEEFDNIFDYYDYETILPLVTSIEEDEDCYNPTWIVTFEWIDNVDEMEKKISNILKSHLKELKSVYELMG